MEAKNLMYQRIGGQREPLSQQVAEQIINLIASHHLDPGDVLPSQQELCQRLGVSRTVIRDALQVLSGLGVIRVSQGVRAQVVKTDPAALSTVMRLSAGGGAKGMENLLSVREILEPEVAALAARHATAKDIAYMEKAIARMDEAIDDAERYVEADQEFHLSLAEATGNDLLPRITFPVVSLLQNMRRVAVRTEGATQRAQTFHRAILEMVKQRDPDAAREAMRGHLAQVRNEISFANQMTSRDPNGGPADDDDYTGLAISSQD